MRHTSSGCLTRSFSLQRHSKMLIQSPAMLTAGLQSGYKRYGLKVLLEDMERNAELGISFQMSTFGKDSVLNISDISEWLNIASSVCRGVDLPAPFSLILSQYIAIEFNLSVSVFYTWF